MIIYYHLIVNRYLNNQEGNENKIIHYKTFISHNPPHISNHDLKLYLAIPNAESFICIFIKVTASLFLNHV